MVKHRRLALIVISIIGIAFCGGLMMWTLNEDCTNLPLTECRLLWGTAIASTMGGVLFLEIVISHKKARGGWQVRERDLRSDGPAIPASWVWFRSIARVFLASLLVGLPLVVKGALGLMIFGAFTGLSLSGLMRGITNRLPPIEEDPKT